MRIGACELNKVGLAVAVVLVLLVQVSVASEYSNQTIGKVAIIKYRGEYTKLPAYALNEGIPLEIKYENKLSDFKTSRDYNGIWIDMGGEDTRLYGYLFGLCFDDLGAYNALNFVKSGGRLFIELPPDGYCREFLEKYFSIAIANEGGIIEFNFPDGGIIFPEWGGLHIGKSYSIGLFLMPAYNTNYVISTVESKSSKIQRTIAISGSIGKGEFKILVDGGHLAADDNIDNYQNKQAVFAMINWLSGGSQSREIATPISKPTDKPQPQPIQTTVSKPGETPISQPTYQAQPQQTPSQIIAGINNDTLILALAIVIAGIAVGVGLSRGRKKS